MEFESKTNTDYYLKITFKDDETLEYKTPHDRGTIDIKELLGFLSERVDTGQILLKMQVDQLEGQSEQESFEHDEDVGYQYPNTPAEEFEQEYRATFHVTPDMREEDIEQQSAQMSSMSVAPEDDRPDDINDERYRRQIIDELYPIATLNFPDDEQEIRQCIEGAVSTVREGLDVFGFGQDWHSPHPEDTH